MNDEPACFEYGTKRDGAWFEHAREKEVTLTEPRHEQPRTRAVERGPVAVIAASVCVLFASDAVSACSCLKWQPFSGFIGPTEVRLPINAAGVLWYQDGGSRLPSEADGFRTSEVAPRILVTRVYPRTKGDPAPTQANSKSVAGFEGVFVVSPKDGLRPGARYLFVEEAHREDWWRANTAAPLELSKGIYVTIDSDELTEDTTLTLSKTPTVFELLKVDEAYGLCSYTDHLPQVLLEARLSGNAPRWRHQLLYKTLVDGEPWRGKQSTCSYRVPGRSWADTAHDIVYGDCSKPGSPSGKPAPTLDASPHSIRMQALLPGTGIVLETEAVTVDLSCPTAEK